MGGQRREELNKKKNLWFTFFRRNLAVTLEKAGNDGYSNRWADSGVFEDMSHLDFLSAWRWGVIKISINNDSEAGNLARG